MNHDTIVELSRRSIFLTKNEEPTISWHNSVIVVRTDRGNHYYQYTYNLECLDKNIDLLEFYTPVPKESPAANLFSHKLFSNSWRNSDFTEMLITPALWPHEPQMVEELTNISVFEWSPRGFVENCECALAVLNNIGNINFYMFIQNRWVSIFSLALHLRQLLDGCYDAPENLSELKHAVNTVDACGMCWAPNLNSDKSCYFVTAQKNGAIVFWSLRCHGANINAKLCGVIKDNSEETSTMLWIPVSTEKFLLVCSDFFGRIIAYECIIEQEEIKSVNLYKLWSHKDRMVIKYFYYITIQNNIVLICNKHRHLVIQMFDEQCKISSQFVRNINDRRITSITNTVEGFYVTTANCKIYKLDFKLINNNLDVAINPVDFKEPCDTYELYSIGFSSNNIMWALAMVNKKAMYRKEPVLLDLIFATSEKNLEAACSILINNPSKKLTEHWDCVELIRYKAMKTNCMPSIDYNNLYTEADTDKYKLKIYLILAKLYVQLKRVIKISNEPLLPETSIELIKERILLNQCTTILNDLYNSYENKSSLSDFDMECFYGAKFYLEFYCKKHEKRSEELIKPDRLSYVKSGHGYLCQCCDNALEGFSCKEGHVNMICSLTFTPIECNDYLVCKSCSCIARNELFPSRPLCVFCDLYLHRSYVNI